jgi:hypothetical protein
METKSLNSSPSRKENEMGTYGTARGSGGSAREIVSSLADDVYGIAITKRYDDKFPIDQALSDLRRMINGKKKGIVWGGSENEDFPKGQESMVDEILELFQ